MRFRPGQHGLKEPEIDLHRVEISAFIDSEIEERVILSVPWAPNCSAFFDPRGVAEMVGGVVTLYASVAGTRMRLTSKTITSASAPVLLEGGAGCDKYELGVRAGLPPLATRPTSYAYARSYSGRLGGAASGPKGLALLAGKATTTAGSVSKQAIGRVYFDPAVLAPSAVTLRAILATNDAVTPQPAFLDLYDVNGITNGGVPGVIAGSQVSVSVLAPTMVLADLAALVGASGPGIIEARLWVGAAAGGVAEATQVVLEVG